MRSRLVRSAAEIRPIRGERVADEHDAAVARRGARAEVLADLGGEGRGGALDELGKGRDHARHEGGAVARPDGRAHEPLRDGARAPPAVDVGEDVGFLGGALGEVLVDEPVEEDLVWVEVAVVGGDYVAMCVWGRLVRGFFCFLFLFLDQRAMLPTFGRPFHLPQDVCLVAHQVKRRVSNKVVGRLFRHHPPGNRPAPRKESSIRVGHGLRRLDQPADGRVKPVGADDQLRGDGLLLRARRVHKGDGDEPACCIVLQPRDALPRQIAGLAVAGPRIRGIRAGLGGVAVEVGAQDAVEIAPVGPVPDDGGGRGDVLAPADGPAGTRGLEGEAQAGVVVLAEELVDVGADLDAGVVAAALRVDVLLEDGDVDALALELQAGDEPA